MKQKTQSKADRQNALLGRIIVGLWIIAIAWLVMLLFYVMVTERYFTDPLAGMLIFLPWTMIVAAVLLQSWRKYGRKDKKTCYIHLVLWCPAWVSILIKTVRH